MTLLRTLFAVNTWTTAGIGLPANFVLLWQILNRTPEKMWVYSRILLQTCVCDIVLLVVQLLGQPVFVMDAHINTSMLMGPLQVLAPPWSSLVVYVWGFLLVMAINQFWIQFYFRFVQLTQNRKLALWRYILGLFSSSALIASTSAAFQLTSSCWRTQYAHKFVDPKVGETLGFISAHPTAINTSSSASAPSDAATTQKNESDVVVNFATRVENVYDQYVFLLCTLCFIASYTIVIVCAIKTERYVRRTMKLRAQKAAREINRQLHRTLCIQALLPPFGAFVVMANQLIFSRNFVTDVELAQTVLSLGLMPGYWIPALNPYVTMTIIQAYHQSLLRGVVRCVSRLLRPIFVLFCRRNDGHPKQKNSSTLSTVTVATDVVDGGSFSSPKTSTTTSTTTSLFSCTGPVQQPNPSGQLKEDEPKNERGRKRRNRELGTKTHSSPGGSA